MKVDGRKSKDSSTTGGIAVGDRLEVTIERPVYRGQGLARHEGQVVFVPGAIPGDRLRVRVDEVTPGWVRAGVVDVLAPGEGRREAPCALADRCGGCSYQGVAYETQLDLKRAVVLDSLRRGGAPWEAPLEVIASPEAGWRMRGRLHPRVTSRGLVLGFREAGSHRVVPLDTCLQLSDAMNAAARALARVLGERGDWVSRLGDVDLAESQDGAERVAVIETEVDPARVTALADVLGRVPQLTGLGVLAGRGQRRRYVHLGGQPHLHARVLGEELRFHALSFFQGNRFLVEPLVAHVRDLLPDGGTVLDLYAGVGLFAIPLARRAEAVRAVELSPTSIEDAGHNVARAALTNVRVERGDVTAALSGWRAADGERVVLDPPRTGAGAEVVRAIAARSPGVIVYVSCDPPTLARDLRLFAELGYRADSMTAFDLFPDTFHVETVVRLRPARSL